MDAALDEAVRKRARFACEYCLMPQGIHRLTHSNLGELELFLVPVGRDSAGFQYEAAFNNLIQP